MSPTRDCDHCKHMRNETCGGLECIGFCHVGFIDTEALQNATDALNETRHPCDPYGSYNVQRAKDRIKSAPSNLIFGPSKGQTLWYRDKFTGEICSGTVTVCGTDRFAFSYPGGETFVSIDAFGSRLFSTKQEAVKAGKPRKPKSAK